MKAVVATVGVGLWNTIQRSYDDNGGTYEKMRSLMSQIQGKEKPYQKPPELGLCWGVFDNPSKQSTNNAQGSLNRQLIKDSPELSSFIKIAEEIAKKFAADHDTLHKNCCRSALFETFVSLCKEYDASVSSRTQETSLERVQQEYLKRVPSFVGEAAIIAEWLRYYCKKPDVEPTPVASELSERKNYASINLYYALAASDTDTGQQAAELIDFLLCGSHVVFYGCSVPIHVYFQRIDDVLPKDTRENMETAGEGKTPVQAVKRIQGLNVHEGDKMQTAGMQYLTAYIEDLHNKWASVTGNANFTYNAGGKFGNLERKIATPIDFRINITAGFKGTVPYLTILGQVLKIPLQYVFEKSQHLVTIPPMSIGFDVIAIEEFLNYLSKGKIADAPDEIYQRMVSLGLALPLDLNSQKLLSPFGQLAKISMPVDGGIMGMICEMKVAEELRKIDVLRNLYTFDKNNTNVQYSVDRGIKFYGYFDKKKDLYFLEEENKNNKKNEDDELWSNGDLDILVKLSHEKKIIAGECKMLFAATGSEESCIQLNVVEQAAKNIMYARDLAKRIKDHKKNSYLFAEYHYFIFTVKGRAQIERIKTFSKKIVKEINRELEREKQDPFPEERFKTIAVFMQDEPDREVNYQSFLERDLACEIIG